MRQSGRGEVARACSCFSLVFSEQGCRGLLGRLLGSLTIRFDGLSRAGGDNEAGLVVDAVVGARRRIR